MPKVVPPSLLAKLTTLYCISVVSGVLNISQFGFKLRVVTTKVEPLNSPSINSLASAWVYVSNPNGVILEPVQLWVTLIAPG